MVRIALLGLWLSALSSCDRHGATACDPEAQAGDLRINELVADNEGVWIDETGQTEDYFEIVNQSDRDIDLSDYEVSDEAPEGGAPRRGDTRVMPSGDPSSGDARITLPERLLRAGKRLLFFADDDAEEGELHLPFKLSSAGETLTISSCGRVIDQVTFPELDENDAYARFPDGDGDFAVCRYGSPERDNGDSCRPPDPQELATVESFDDYEWPEAHPQLPSPLALSELALRPAAFIELYNTSDEVVALSEFTLTVSPLAPGVPLPKADAGTAVALGDGPLGDGQLAAGQRLTVALTDSDVEEIAADPAFEGVVSLFRNGAPVDRIDFMRWPEGATLARPQTNPHSTAYCTNATRDEENDCEPLPSRDVGNRVRHLRTPSDFMALAEGGTKLGTTAVKWIVDRIQSDASNAGAVTAGAPAWQGGSVYFLRTADWDLHYTFVREEIDGDPPLDRCDTSERSEFNQGWYDFSVSEYFAPEGRRYFLGNLLEHGSTGHRTLEFALGDEILAENMRDAFFAVTAHVPDPTAWLLRPHDASQIARARSIEGSLPLLSPNAPYRDLEFQPLTLGEGFGVLTWVPAAELGSAALGRQVILVTDDVPNDIPLTGGLITQAFQTPLSHVNVLSQNRGTPNMALRNGRDDERIADYLGQLVRLTVSASGFSIEPAEAEDAEAFWEEHRPTGPLQAPRLDSSVRELVALNTASLADLPAIGAKASQFAELMRLDATGHAGTCRDAAGFDVPERAFAIPVARFLDHLRASGAEARFADVRAEARFVSDPIFRSEQLTDVRELILAHPVDSALLDELDAAVATRFGTTRVRLRSSSNAEDLPGFNGAGLYTSASAERGDETRRLEDALRTVWASLFNSRAYDERELARIDHDAVAMGVLVHEAFRYEAANGVGVSRNVLEPNRGDQFYLNAQAGEASVTNPAPGITTEALVYQLPPREPMLTHHSASSLTRGEAVLSSEEATAIACGLSRVHDHFLPLLDPDGEDTWFAMEVEFKLLYPSRELVIKQARPHAFGGMDAAGDCREL